MRPWAAGCVGHLLCSLPQQGLSAPTQVGDEVALVCSRGSGLILSLPSGQREAPESHHLPGGRRPLIASVSALWHMRHRYFQEQACLQLCSPHRRPGERTRHLKRPMPFALRNPHVSLTFDLILRKRIIVGQDSKISTAAYQIAGL